MLKHTDDDGDLSIFAADTEILIACTNGHYWTIPATVTDISEDAMKDEGGRADVFERFGPTAVKAMGFRDP